MCRRDDVLAGVFGTPQNERLLSGKEVDRYHEEPGSGMFERNCMCYKGCILKHLLMDTQFVSGFC
jgi:hypothetical protein